MDRKFGGDLHAPLGRDGFVPSDIMWPGTRPTSLPSFTLIHRPFGHNRTTLQTERQDRQTGPTDRQRSYSTGRTVLQAVTHNVSAISTVLFSFILAFSINLPEGEPRTFLVVAVVSTSVCDCSIQRLHATCSSRCSCCLGTAIDDDNSLHSANYTEQQRVIRINAHSVVCQPTANMLDTIKRVTEIGL